MGAMADKEFIVIEGATHGIGNCTVCAAYWGTGPYMMFRSILGTTLPLGRTLGSSRDERICIPDKKCEPNGEYFRRKYV